MHNMVVTVGRSKLSRKKLVNTDGGEIHKTTNVFVPQDLSQICHTNWAIFCESLGCKPASTISSYSGCCRIKHCEFEMNMNEKLCISASIKVNMFNFTLYLGIKYRLQTTDFGFSAQKNATWTFNAEICL